MHFLLFFLVFLSLSKSNLATESTTEKNRESYNTEDNTNNITDITKTTAAIIVLTTEADTIRSPQMDCTQTTKPLPTQNPSGSKFVLMDLNNPKEMILWCIIFFLVLVCFLQLIIILTLTCRRNNVGTLSPQRTENQTNPTTFQSINNEPFETVVMTNYNQQEPENETEMVTLQEVEYATEVEKEEDAIPTTLEVNGNPVSDAASLPEPETSEKTELINEESTSS